MLFSRTTEYALRAVVWLADNADRPQAAPQIAAATQISPGYVSNVMAALGRAGLVTARRGMGGGFSLARDPREISILDVVNAVDPIERIESCPLHLPSHGSQLCPLHRRLDDAIAYLQRTFAKSSIAEILEDSSEIRALCESTSLTVDPDAVPSNALKSLDAKDSM